jgi:dTDP-4-dehydrorhamnose 3,5-epimerase-like enzyme
MKKKEPYLHKDKRGFFSELLRTTRLFKQISLSEVNKGVIKGWHGHHHQLQWTFILKGTANILIKKKNKIKKINVKNKIFGYLLKKKELHAYKVLSEKILVLYLTTGFFSPIKDEYRTKMTKRELEILNFK